MRAMYAMPIGLLALLIPGGCPAPESGTSVDTGDLTNLPLDATNGAGNNPEVINNIFAEGGSGGDDGTPLTISDLFDQFDNLPDDDPPLFDPCAPTFEEDNAPPTDNNEEPNEDENDDAGAAAPGDDSGTGDDASDDGGSGDADGDDPNDAGSGDGDAGNTDDGGDDGSDDGDEGSGDTGDEDPVPPAALIGQYTGTITCQSWQAVVGQDPNLFELPDEPAIGLVDVDLAFSAGAPDGLWIPGFIDGPDIFAEVSEAGQLVVINDSYDTWSVICRVEVLEASYDGETARTVANVTYRVKDEQGNLLIRAQGVCTQQVVAQVDGTADYSNKLDYEAVMWNPQHTISFDVVELYDCGGVLD